MRSTGWDKTRQYLFDIECFAADAPIQLPFGLKMVAPVIMRYGSDAQKARFCPAFWMGPTGGARAIPNGYRLRPGLAEDARGRAGDHYVVNGQRHDTWASADWIFCLVRTDPVPSRNAGSSSF